LNSFSIFHGFLLKKISGDFFQIFLRDFNIGILDFELVFIIGFQRFGIWDFSFLRFKISKRIWDLEFFKMDQK
jgi:hypothetical protein